MKSPPFLLFMHNYNITYQEARKQGKIKHRFKCKKCEEFLYEMVRTQYNTQSHNFIITGEFGFHITETHGCPVPYEPEFKEVFSSYLISYVISLARQAINQSHAKYSLKTNN